MNPESPNFLETKTSTASPHVVLEAVRLTKTLGDKRVLAGIDVVIHRAECIALIGDNGAGKTTLLRCWTALTRPTGGIVKWFGHTPPLPTSFKNRIGFAAHEGALYPELSARENLTFAARMSEVINVQSRVEDWLASSGLAQHADKQARQLSRGLQQRLSIARSMIQAPELLLLDEPFTGLDSSGGDWLCAVLRTAYTRGQTVVFTTHERKWVQELATRVLHLNSGRLQERRPLELRAPRFGPDQLRAA